MWATEPVIDWDVMLAVKEQEPNRALDHAVEDRCFDVCGWPLFGDEVTEVARASGCNRSLLTRTEANPLSMWRRFGGALPSVTRSLEASLVQCFSRSMGVHFVERVTPAVWVSKKEKENHPIYGSSYPCSGTGPRKGGMRTAYFIGEDVGDLDQLHERFVAQCVQDFCIDGTRTRMAHRHSRRCLEIADNGGYHEPRLPDFYTCEVDCTLCRDEYTRDGRTPLPTTWKRLLHRAEMFLFEWELVRVEGAEPYCTGNNWGDLEFWPFIDFSGDV